jgi:hypothetical protein
MLEAVANVFQFEFRRSLTPPRIAMWCALVAFPSVLLILVRLTPGPKPDELFVSALFILIPEVTCMLALLLWMTPAIQSELESSAWPYLAIRPRGRRAVLIGKYLNAVLWTFATMTVSLSCAIVIADPLHLTKTFIVLFMICSISALAYGTLYALIAVAIPQRAMIMALAYSVVVEGIIGFIPAVINQLTFNFRLRAMFVQWMGWDKIPRGISSVTVTNQHSIVHFLLILVMMAVIAKVTLVILDRRQFVASDEG